MSLSISIKVIKIINKPPVEATQKGLGDPPFKKLHLKLLIIFIYFSHDVGLALLYTILGF